jgi:biopolymer transport protein ExbD
MCRVNHPMSIFMKPKPVSREMVIRGVHHDVVGISSVFPLQVQGPEVRVQLQADDGVNYGEVARAMASIERAGVTRLSVITAR